jgi:hypothetical protein
MPILFSPKLTLQSEDTHARARKSNIETLPTDISLVEKADYILSIVPPRDALTIATRITTAFNAAQGKQTPLYYLDLNAVSPRTAREIAALFQSSAPAIRFIDGGIIGLPPSPTSSSDPSPSSNPSSTTITWRQPSIPVSGPHRLNSAAGTPGALELAQTLKLNHISDDIGPASGLKCSFSSLTKGFTALCLQAFTTASNMGVLPLLLQEAEMRAPGLLKAARVYVPDMPPKAYRWVREMQELAITHADEGGFEGGAEPGEGVFGQIANVYRSVAEETVLGEEKTERRKRGTSLEDVASAMGEGLQSKRRKVEEGR